MNLSSRIRPDHKSQDTNHKLMMAGRSEQKPAGGSREVRLAVVGVGHLGRHHARVASSIPGIRVVGIHDHNNARSAEVARELGLNRLPSLEAVAAEADAAVVATPTATHLEVAAVLLDRGLDVLVEKPIA